VGEKGCRVRPLVDALEAKRPAARPQVARIPREAARTILRKFVTKRARIGLFGQLENTARVRVVRRDIARLKTIARQKRAGEPALAAKPTAGAATAAKPKRAPKAKAPAKAKSKSKSKA